MLALTPAAPVPSPLVTGLALAMLGVTTAETETELRKSLKDFGEAVRAFREALRDLMALTHAARAVIHYSTPERLRSSLEAFLDAEAGIIDLRGKFATFLKSLRYRERLSAPNLPFGLGDFHALNRELRSNVLPLLRSARATLILEIARRANEAGVHVINPSEEFRKMFVSATLKESRGWQETAHLLADLDSAKRLQASIGSESLDKTEAFDFIAH